MSLDLPALRPIRGTLGGQVPPGQVVGRDDVVTRWWRDLETGSLRLNEPRRMGKTSALVRMAELAPPGWVCVRQTVQDATSTRELVESTLDAFRSHATVPVRVWERVRAFLRGAGEVEARAGGVSVRLAADFADSPLATFERVLESAATELADSNQRLAIIWDEFPDALAAIRVKEGANAAADVLAKFRGLREGPAGRSVRFVLAGSVGFHHVLRDLRNNRAVLNDMRVVELGPLNERWSRWFAQCLLSWNGREVLAGDADRIAQAADGIPFLIEHMAVRRRRSGESTPLDAGGADELLIELADSETLDDTWAHLLERADQYYGEDRADTMAVLDALAACPHAKSDLAAMLPADSRDRLAVILPLLRSDHYIAFDRATGAWRWRYDSLRRVWQLRREGL